jgi:phenylacetate-CoA ligase
MTTLEVRCELLEGGDPVPIEREVRRLLEERLRVRTDVHVLPPGTLPRQETGKARRVFERLDEGDPVVAA